MLWTCNFLHMTRSVPPLWWLALAAIGGLAPSPSALLQEHRQRGNTLGQEKEQISNNNYALHPCPNCVLPQDRPQELDLDLLRIESIKQQLLSKLGMKAKPNVTSLVPREVLLQTLHRSEEARLLLQDAVADSTSSIQHHSFGLLEEDDYYAKTSEIISFAEPGPHLNNHTLLQFSQSSEDVGSLLVQEASLWVFIRRLPGAPWAWAPLGKYRPQTKLWVFELPSDYYFSENPSGRLVSTLNITLEDVGWKQLDVTEAVQWWFRRSGDPLRLLVDCSSCGGELKAELFTAKKHKGAHKPGSRRFESTHRPFLVIRTRPTPSRRLNRRALQCDAETKLCCKQNFFVSFKDLGWDDWIVAPSGYHANYCKGSCSSLYRTLDSFTNYYSHIAEEMRRKALVVSLTQCCAPTKLSPMTLIYLDAASNIIMRNVPRMVVEECGCA